MASAIPEPAFLHKLPPELRNVIYRLALVRQTSVPVTASGLVEPGLLIACKSIRREAGPLFYGENDFSLDVSDYDSTSLRFWTKRKPSLGNLIAWCRDFHGGRSRYGLHGSDILSDPLRLATIPMRVACAMLAIAKKLHDRPWEEAEAMLLPYRKILEGLEPGWEV